MYEIGKGTRVPNVTFQTRVRDDSIEGDNPFRWQTTTTEDYFGGKRVVVFSLPGAFTPTCSTMQVPGFEQNYRKLQSLGIDHVYCISVNDAFVMNKWAADQQIRNIGLIPDGSCEFTRAMGMAVKFDNRGFGERSWRYAMVVNDCIIEHIFEEPGRCENSDPDPYGETSPENIMAWLAGAN